MTEFKRVKDIGTLIRWRAEVLNEVFGDMPSPELIASNVRFYNKHIADESHIAYVALWHGIEAGCGSICMYDEMPSPDNFSGQCAYLMNIYVRAPYRNQGIATAMVKRLVEDAETYGCGKIYLETTDMGKPVYKCLGFNDMKGFMKYEHSNI